MLSLVLAVLFGAYFGVSDRFSGGGLGWQKLSHDGGGPLRGHGIFYPFIAGVIAYLIYAAVVAVSTHVAFGAALLSVLTKFPQVAVAVLTFSLWRAPGWDIIKGACIDPRTTSQKIATFFRHALVLLPLGGAVALGFAGWPVLIAGLAFAAAATFLAVENAKGYDRGEDNNDTVELNRGIAFGVLMGLALGLPVS